MYINKTKLWISVFIWIMLTGIIIFLFNTNLLSSVVRSLILLLTIVTWVGFFGSLLKILDYILLSRHLKKHHPDINNIYQKYYQEKLQLYQKKEENV